MKWRVEFRPEVEQDVAEAAAWYEARQPGLGRICGRSHPSLGCSRAESVS